jgi:hypothetical protein
MNDFLVATHSPFIYAKYPDWIKGTPQTSPLTADELVATLNLLTNSKISPIVEMTRLKYISYYNQLVKNFKRLR